jgi:hypothetical protein
MQQSRISYILFKLEEIKKSEVISLRQYTFWLLRRQFTLTLFHFIKSKLIDTLTTYLKELFPYFANIGELFPYFANIGDAKEYIAKRQRRQKTFYNKHKNTWASLPETLSAFA